MEAYLLIQTETETGPIAWELKDIAGVSLAQDLHGPYDAIVLAQANERPLEAVIADVQRFPGVVRTLAAPLVSSLASDPDIEAA